MTGAKIAGGAFATVLLLIAGAAGYRAFKRTGHPAAATSAITPVTTPDAKTHAAAKNDEGFIHGRIITVDGAHYEGRLRWGGTQEAFWGDYFNGSKHGNTWLAQVPPEARPKKNDPLEIFGIKLADRVTPIEVRRPLMARFGDIARIEARSRDVRVTLKSGTAVDLDRLEASDFDDGVRVWDVGKGIVDLDSLRIRSIELLPAVSQRDAPYRLHGTVRTRRGDFTGFVQWNREKCVGTDGLDGRTAEAEISVPFDTIRAIERRSRDSALVTRLDGRAFVLAGTPDVGHGNLGIYVDDPRYGRVLVSWDAFERIDLTAGGSGPAYGDFPAGRPLAGSVITRAGRRLAGRLVYDLDESETTETLDASSQGIDYTIPFGLVASIVVPHDDSGAEGAVVTLQSGEELTLERTGDLGPRNAGVLIFVEGSERPEYVPWIDVAQVEFDRPPAMYPTSC
jgi:hypothetical protein